METFENWPLVGREYELAVLTSMLGGAESRGLLLLGNAWVGKSRLLRTVRDRAAAAGRATQLIVATRAAGSIPFGAASRLLPDDWPVTNQRALGARVFQHVARRLSEQPGDQPALIAVDDAHLLDDPSAALVHYLAVEGVAQVAATLCSGWRPPDAIFALVKDGLARRLEVPPLPDIDIEVLLGHALPGQISGPAAAELGRLAGGNPLFLRELLSTWRASGALREQGGLWSWNGHRPGAGQLRDLVEARLPLPGHAGRAVAELVACGEPLPLAVLDASTTVSGSSAMSTDSASRSRNSAIVSDSQAGLGNRR